MLALIVIIKMGKGSQALSSRQREPTLVCVSASGVRVPPQVGKSLVKRASLRLGGAPGWVLGRGAVREKIGFTAG